jgi:ankyrin repeat protein
MARHIDDPAAVPPYKVLLLRGKVAISPGETFSVPFEAPADGGCVRFRFDVVDSDAAVSFAVVQAGNGAVLHTTKGTGRRGECSLPAGGELCLVRWENVVSLFAGLFSSERPNVSYEVEVLPQAHLDLVQRKRLVRLAESGGGDLRSLGATLERLPASSTDDRGRTPLHGAAAWGHVDAVALLLNANAPLEATCREGRTPLLDACVHCQVGTMVGLLAAGASASAIDARGRNALHLVAASGRSGEAILEACGLILDLGPRGHALTRQLCAPSAGRIDAGAPGGTTPLVHAAAAGQTRLCSTLLAAGVDVNECDGQALAAAARCGHDATVRALLAAGADPTLETEVSGSALHTAAGAGHVSLVRLLSAELAQRASESAHLLRTDGAWRSPLLCAAAGGHGESVEVLVAAGSPVEQADREGNTPLLSACAVGEPKAVSVLLQAGADPRRRNSSGKDALCCAAAGGHLPLLPLLLPACTDRLVDAMVQAAAAGQGKTAVALVELCPLPLPLREVANGRGEAPSAAHEACELLVRAIWERCSEEEAAASAPPTTQRRSPSTSPYYTTPAPSVEDYGAAVVARAVPQRSYSSPPLRQPAFTSQTGKRGLGVEAAGCVAAARAAASQGPPSPSAVPMGAESRAEGTGCGAAASPTGTGTGAGTGAGTSGTWPMPSHAASQLSPLTPGVEGDGEVLELDLKDIQELIRQELDGDSDDDDVSGGRGRRAAL